MNQEAQEAQSAFDSSLVFVKFLLNTYGFWPYDMKNYKECKGLKEIFYWGLRRVVLVTNAMFLASEVLYIFLVAQGDIIPSVECVITLVALTFYAAVTYILYYRRDSVIYVINTLRSYTILTEQRNYKMFKENAARMRLLSYVLYITTGICIFVYIGIPLWLAYKEQQSNKTGRVQRPLPFHSWYPYNQSENPFYQVSMALELFRGIGMLNVVTGYDGLFASILFYTCGQYDALKHNFENIYELAVKNLQSRKEPLTGLDKEVGRLLKTYIKRHIALNDLCAKEEEVYSLTIFIHLFLHALILCSVVYLMLISMDNEDYWSVLKFLTFKMLLIIELFMYGYIGTNLIHATTSLGDGCFHSEWYATSRECQRSLQIVMHRAQTPCTLTGLSFSVLSPEIVLPILSSSYSYFTLLNTFN